MRRSRHILLSFMLPALLPALSRAQAQAGSMIRPEETASVYENSAAGLHLQLQDALAAAKNHDRSRLESLIRQMEIPNYETWFTNTFGEEKGKAWAGSYARYLGENERELADLLMRLSDESGRFSVDTVRGDKTVGEISSAMVEALRRPTEIFFADWKRPGTQNLVPTPMGYFFFVDGKFRWFSAARSIAIQPPPGMNNEPSQASGKAAESSSGSALAENDRSLSRPGTDGVGYPSCDHCPFPQYTEAARRKGLEGKVVLQVIVRADGTIADIHVVESSSPELSEMAVEGVSKWRMNPAHRADGEPVAVIAPVEITFRLRR